MTMRLPESIEEVSLADIKAAMTAAIRQAQPALTIDEGSPVKAIIDILAAREFVSREYWNVRVRRNTIPYATGVDLDTIGILLNTRRNEGEVDTDYRIRLETAFAQISPVSEQAFLANAKAAVPAVFDANYLVSNIKATAVYVLATDNDGGTVGMPSAATRTAVLAYLNDPSRHLITDTLSCPAPTINDFAVVATITYTGMQATVSAGVTQAIAALNNRNFRLGRPWYRSEVSAAIQGVPGVVAVVFATGTAADQASVARNVAYRVTTFTPTYSLQT